MQQKDIHVFQGMKRDVNPIRQDKNFLWDGLNIRFTAKENNTFLTMTNEKGNNKLTSVSGKYLGHCSLGDYLVLFTYDTSDNTIIYRISNDNSSINSLKIEKLFEGFINSDIKHPFQTLGVYESELVQKVYWADGVNQPRVINVVADKLLNKDAIKDNIYNNGESFNFVPNLQLKERVTINKITGGEFTPGIIQYAFSYYYKYGQESNIFYTSPLYYITSNNRGGNPEEVVQDAFEITIENIENTFDFIRVYSIHRTSYNTTPNVKIVKDISIEGNSNKVTIVDTGTTGDIIDPAKLLFIGGEPIIAQCIKSFSNTLFLGNIESIKLPIDDSIKNLLKDKEQYIYIDKESIKLSAQSKANEYYTYSNQLYNSNIKYFKGGDYYRLGVQFQHKTGKWSEPVFIGNYLMPKNTLTRPVLNNDTLVIPKLCIKLKDLGITKTLLGDYSRMRGVVVFPSSRERMTLAQGILCPTVFSINSRISNSPFAQASWFYRPFILGDISTEINSTDIDKGAVIQYKHLEPLLPINNRGAEIQNMPSIKFSEANSSIKAENYNNDDVFYIDQSIITLNSPDIEFDDTIKHLIENEDLKLDIIGVVPFKSNMGDISIETSSAVPAPNDGGFYHKSLSNYDYSTRRLATGFFYKAHAINDDSNKQYSPHYGYDSNYEFNWLVYPWQRVGSLNNDMNRPDNSTRTSVLKKKVISNLLYSEDNIWLDNIWSSESNNGITSVSVFDSNEISLSKLPIPNNSHIKNSINYYGNINTLVTTSSKYPYYITNNKDATTEDGSTGTDNFKGSPRQLTFTSIGDFGEQLRSTKDPVRLQYKSSPHAVFSLNYHLGGNPIILPSIKTSDGTLNAIDTITDIPFWSDVDNNYKKINFIISIALATIQETEPQKIIDGTINWLNTNYKNPTGILVGNETIAFAIGVDPYHPKDPNYAKLYRKIIASNTTWEEALGGNYIGKIIRVDKSISYTPWRDTTWEVIKINDIETLVPSTTATYKVYQDVISSSTRIKNGLFIGELVKKNVPDNLFNGNTEEAIQSNQWLPAGEPIDIPTTLNDTDYLKYNYGDTYYQRYDSLKTFPFSNEDLNSVVEIASFMCETKVNIDGRYDRNRGNFSNLNVSNINFNLLNPVYNQQDNFFNYRILDSDYYKVSKYPSQIVWTLPKNNMEELDNWTNITLANSVNLEGSSGEVTSINTFNELLIAFQSKSINQLLFNSRVQLNPSDGVPIEIGNSNKMEGTRKLSDKIGCQDKWSIKETQQGIYFIDNNTDTLWLYNGQVEDISNSKGCYWWFNKYHTDKPWYFGNNNSKILNYDRVHNDLYITLTESANMNTLCYSETLGNFTSRMSYSNCVMDNLGNRFLALSNSINPVTFNNETTIWENYKGEYNTFFGNIIYPEFTFISNDNSTETKIFNSIEYRADILDSYNNSNEEGQLPVLHNETFDWIRAFNEYQDSRIVNSDGTIKDSQLTKDIRSTFFEDVSTKKKFRVWRTQLPRCGKFERFRNPWTAITLGFKERKDRPSVFKMAVHDINTNYTI